MGHLLAYLLLQVVLLFDALGWEVKMPKEIHGLRGSCLVIPCSFSYTSDPPEDPRRVVWYQWVSRGYPLVYDDLHEDDVIEKFRGKTYLYITPYVGDCTLLIENLEQSHHEEKLYTWIDPENVGWRTYAFYEVTSTILVDASPQSPSISIYGGERMGEMIAVTCSTSHTCPYSEPTITLNGIVGSDQTNDDCDTNGQCRITLTRTGVVKAERMTIGCFVEHNGGITASATKDKSAKCVHQQIKIEPELADVTEGIAKIFTCSVYHSCQRETPTITWNYRNMQVSTGRKTLSGENRVTYSAISFLSMKEDHGKKLTCLAKFSGGNIEASVVLRVQQHQKPVENPNRDEKHQKPVENPNRDQTHFQYEADVIPWITALTHSCVVIPCSFKIEKKDVSNLHVLWVTEKNDFMFHSNTGNILNSFKDRTKLLGNPNEQNCTVEINDVQTHDKGLFCLQAEKDNKKYSFSNSCVLIVLRESPDKPVMSSLPEDIEPGTQVTIKCAVNHTCSSHPPEITWSVPTSRETVSHSPMGGGVWETESAVTLSSTGYEDKDNIVCSVKFWGITTQETMIFLSVKRVQEVGFWPYIASSLVFIFICIFAGVFIYKRRNRINNTSNESGSRNFSKPYMPSPKSEPKSHSGNDYEAEYANMDDLNVYGNV